MLGKWGREGWGGGVVEVGEVGIWEGWGTGVHRVFFFFYLNGILVSPTD